MTTTLSGRVWARARRTWHCFSLNHTLVVNRSYRPRQKALYIILVVRTTLASRPVDIDRLSCYAATICDTNIATSYLSARKTLFKPFILICFRTLIDPPVRWRAVTVVTIPLRSTTALPRCRDDCSFTRTWALDLTHQTQIHSGVRRRLQPIQDERGPPP